ncbi:MAG: uracil-DNA glycosylase, partial [SAR324 cluster bacterium]|nr:uracil-DNA glycosylase [SAR324 cluster bacterium]
DELSREIRDCHECELSRGRTCAVPGEGPENPALFFLGEAPGWHEDQQGRPFVGPAGKFLDELIASVGYERGQVFITNVVKCRPPGNRNPEPLEVSSCMSILEGQLKLVSPKLIVTLGNVPTRALLPDIQGITKVRGKPVQFKNWTLLPTFHPSYLLRNRTAMSLAWKDFRMIASMAFGSEG